MSSYNTKESFKEKLDNEYQWPSLYMFKFIVPSDKEEEVARLFPGKEMTIKESNKGNYMSITVKLMMHSSDEVIAIYEQAHQIENVIAL